MKIDHVKSWTAGGVGIGSALFFALMLAIAAVGAKAGSVGPWSQPSIPDGVRTVNGPGSTATRSGGASARTSTARAASVLGVRTPVSDQPFVVADVPGVAGPAQTPTDQVASEPEQEEDEPVQPNDPTQPDTQTPPTPPSPPVPTPNPQTPTPLPTPQPSPTDPSESPSPTPAPPTNAPAPGPPSQPGEPGDDDGDDEAGNPNDGNGKGGKGQGGKPKKKD